MKLARNPLVSFVTIGHTSPVKTSCNPYRITSNIISHGYFEVMLRMLTVISADMKEIPDRPLNPDIGTDPYLEFPMRRHMSPSKQCDAEI